MKNYCNTDPPTSALARRELEPVARPVILRFPTLTPAPKETLSMVDTTADTVEMPSIPQIQHKLRRLVDFQQREVFGIDVIRWPGWGKWCYEIESYGGRPGGSWKTPAPPPDTVNCA